MFRLQEPARLIINFNQQRKIAVLLEPTMQSLMSTITAVCSLNGDEDLCFFVVRDKLEYALENERDLEELGGNLLKAHEREDIFVCLKEEDNKKDRPALRTVTIETFPF